MIADDYPFCNWCEDTLFYISLVGSCLSIFGLLITIVYDLGISLIPNSKSENSNQKSEFQLMYNQKLKLITTWCFVLLIMNAFYIAFAYVSSNAQSYNELNTKSRDVCISIGVILHFSLLSSFFFSFLITLLYYVLFFFNIPRYYKHIYLKGIALSFGILINKLYYYLF